MKKTTTIILTILFSSLAFAGSPGSDGVVCTNVKKSPYAVTGVPELTKKTVGNQASAESVLNIYRLSYCESGELGPLYFEIDLNKTLTLNGQSNQENVAYYAVLTGENGQSGALEVQTIFVPSGASQFHSSTDFPGFIDLKDKMTLTLIPAENAVSGTAISFVVQTFYFNAVTTGQ